MISSPEEIELAPAPPTEIEPTSTPTLETLDPAFFPSGVLSMGGGTTGVRLTTLDGLIIDEMHFQGFSPPPSKPSRTTRFHFGSTTEQGVIKAPCIFYTSVYGKKQISFHESKSPIIELQEIEGLINLVGPPRLPIVIFSTFDPENLQNFNHNRFTAPSEDDSQPTPVPPTVDSWLYTANRDILPESEILLSYSDESGYAIFPLEVNMVGDTLKGVWYTLSFEAMHGGGPIIYNGHRGLYYLDIESKQIQKVLDMDHRFLSFSSSHSLAAYIIPGNGINGTVVIQNIDTGSLLEVDILPDTNPTGIGRALFSPSDTSLAWQEHYLGEERMEIIFRFSSILDGELLEINSTELIEETADMEVYHISMVGWADDQRIILEALSQDKADLYILELPDLSLEYLAPGNFIGFTYP
jgi:hypothetical protein